MTDGTESKNRPTAALTQKKGKAKPRRVGQIIPRGENKWVVRVPLGPDESTGKRLASSRTSSSVGVSFISSLLS
jgi:hypothetical protein